MSAFLAPASSAMTTTAPPPSTDAGAAATDERDLFISWLRGEFAAANAIIDLLLTHLRLTGGPGEYEHVISSVHQRRAHWAPILHLQQYYPVADVAIALQHAAWSRHQGVGLPQMAPPLRQQQQGPQAMMPRSGRRYGHGNDHGSGYSSGSGFNNNRRYYSRSWSDFGTNRDSNRHNEEGSEVSKEESIISKEREGETSAELDSCKSNSTDPKGVTSQRDGSSESLPQNGGSNELTDEKKMIPKEFVSNELTDGKTVNAFEGLKVYEELFDISEVQSILCWVNETRAAGRRGELQGQTFITAKRPNKGHGREVIQLGIPIIEGPPDDENNPVISHERKVEPVPVLVQGVLNKLSQIITFKPDYCVIDFFNEGDHSHPNIWPSWYGRPVGTVCLTECDMIFGRHIIADHKGDHRGPLELSLQAGSLVLVRSRGADMAKRAIPSRRKNRTLLTFGKSQPRRPSNHNLSISSSTAPSSPSPPLPWAPARPPPLNHHRPNPNQVQQVLIPALPVVTAVATVPVPVPVPVAVAPRVPLPGTGVFLPPPGSGQPPPPPPFPPANLASLNTSEAEKNDALETANGVVSKGESKQNGDCNGSVEGKEE